MKNKKAESLFRKKGFYVALYSCLGIVMISAAVFSFSSLLNNDPPAPIKPQAELDYNPLDLADLQPVDKSNTQSYLTPEDREVMGLYPVSTATPRAAATPPPSQEPSAVTTAAPTAQATLEAAATPAAEPEQPQVPVQRSSESVTDSSQTETEPMSDDIEIALAPEFTPYSAEAPMNWPVVGELVMDFSTSSLIYDKTLNQYRTNDNLCIGASIGTQVKATAEGLVKEITNTREKGNTIVIDHGNGWQSVYSELQDGILVKEGDIVKEGQVIGGVGAPSIYNVLMGSHLQFAITKDGVKIDPKTVLATN